MSILVIGGAGYIGSHTVKLLKKIGASPIIYDNLTKGHKQVVDILKVPFFKGDLGDKKALREVFEREKIKAVMHFAASIEVGESVIDPAKYYINNVANVLNLLEIMREYNINYFVFSSTAATFGEPQSNKVSESHSQNPINPYGRSKLMVEQILKDYDRAYDFHSVVLRYFNASGADDEGELGESHDPETHLLPIILQAASAKRDSIKIFGTDYKTKDGTCVRDFIHVYDLAEAHILAMEKMMREGRSLDYNLGSSEGFTVKEIIEAVKEVTNLDFKVEEAARRPGDPAILVADSTKAREELSWKPKYNLRDIIKHSWSWEQNRKF